MQMILSLICLAILAFGVVYGFVRRSNRTVFRLITLLLSAVGALFLAKVAMRYAGDSIIGLVKNYLQGYEGIATFLTENPDFTNAIFNVLQMLLAPLLFLIFYLALKLLTLILYKIICFIFRIKGPRFFGRLLGAGVGLACGFVGVLVLVVPVCGYTALVGDTLEQLYPGEGQSKTVMQIKEICKLDEAPIAGTVYNVLGDVLFTQLTTAEFGGESVQLQNEIGTILSVVSNAKVLGQNSIENYGTKEADAVDGMAEGIGSSALLSHVGSLLLGEVSNAWLEGDAFFGVSRPQADANANGLLNAFLTVFSTSDAENIDEDLGTFADMFDLLVKHGMFALLSDSAEEDALAKRLVEPGVLEEFYATLDKNPRMLPVKAAIADIGVRMLMQQLGGSPEELKEQYGDLLSDVAGSIKSLTDENGNIDTVALKGELSGVLATHEITVDDAAVQLVADGFAEAFTPEELSSMTTDQMVDRLVERFTSADAMNALADAMGSADAPLAQ